MRRTSSPVGGEVVALQGHSSGIHGVGTGLNVGTGSDIHGGCVVVTTTTTTVITG